MEMEMENPANKTGSLQSVPKPNPQLLDWLIEQLTILAVAFGSPENVTAERLRIYAQEICDLPTEQLALAFARARRELTFFPSIAELRELAGGKPDHQTQVKAEAAWQFANEYLQKYGVAIYDDDNRPPLDACIDYALRRIGGLNGLNQITEKSRAFIFKDFCQAYRQAPIADLLRPQLTKMFGYHKLASSRHKQLTGKIAHGPDPHTREPEIIKSTPEPLTSDQLRDRREMLRQQAEQFERNRQRANQSA